MKNFSFENQGTYTYLVYEFGPEDVIDSMSLGMLTNNRISGLASAAFSQVDTVKYLKYDVTSRVSVKKFFAGAVNRKRLLGVFQGIVNGLLAAEEYMIEESSILLDPEYIFADVTTCDTVLICLPVERVETTKIDLGEFFKTIIFSVQFDPTENSEHVVKIMNYLNSTPAFSLASFKQVLDDLQAQKGAPSPAARSASGGESSRVTAPRVQPAVPASAYSPAPRTPAPRQKPVEAPAPKAAVKPAAAAESGGESMSLMHLLRNFSKENLEIYKSQQKKPDKAEPARTKKEKTAKTSGPMDLGFSVPGQKSASLDMDIPAPVIEERPVVRPAPRPAEEQRYSAPAAGFGETTVLTQERSSETTVLTDTPAEETKIRPRLIRQRNQETVYVTKDLFRIGKEKSYVDYFIGDNTAISRSHATILLRDGAYYIEDDNSKNHTFVNGTMIQSGTPVKLEHGTAITLANEAFEFRLY